MRHLANPIIVMILVAVSSQAQTVRLTQAETQARSLVVAVGEVIDVEILIDLQDSPAAGAVVFLSIDVDAFEALDNVGVDDAGTQPFLPGPLFNSAPVTNILLSETTDPVAKQMSGLQLDYGTVLADLTDLPTGSGVLASMKLLAIKPTQQALLLIDDNPIRETRLVAEDLATEVRFRTVGGMEITVVDAATAVAPLGWGEIKRTGHTGSR